MTEARRYPPLTSPPPSWEPLTAHLSRANAEKLAHAIRDAWARVGEWVEVRVISEGEQFVVRSDLRNGYPPPRA